MDNNFTVSDWDVILESLRYTKLKFEAYPYPTNEMRRERVAEVEAVIGKARAARAQARGK